MIFWAYAITDRAPEEAVMKRLTADSGRTLTMLDLGGSIALGASFDSAPAPDLEEIQRHETVVRRIHASCSATLPMRFGAATSGEEEFLDWARERSEVIASGLASVRDAHQVTIRLFSNEPDAPLDPPAAQSGTEYLKARARLARVDLPSWLVREDGVRSLVRAQRVERGEARIGERVRIYHLVSNEQLRAHADALGQQQRSEVGLRYGSPSPAWAFVPEHLT